MANLIHIASSASQWSFNEKPVVPLKQGQHTEQETFSLENEGHVQGQLLRGATIPPTRRHVVGALFVLF